MLKLCSDLKPDGASIFIIRLGSEGGGFGGGVCSS